MFVFSNRRLGAAAEVLVSRDLAAAMLRAVAAVAAATAASHWERELARWLETREVGATPNAGLDVTDLAWSPDHFANQQRFLLDAIAGAGAAAMATAGALQRWARLIEAHPRAFVQVGRRWNWAASA